jgi:hypothetical protein
MLCRRSFSARAKPFGLQVRNVAASGVPQSLYMAINLPQ